MVTDEVRGFSMDFTIHHACTRSKYFDGNFTPVEAEPGALYEFLAAPPISTYGSAKRNSLPALQNATGDANLVSQTTALQL